MNNVRLSSILALLLILFLSLAVVSANDDLSINNVTDTQDSIIDNSNGISDYFLKDKNISLNSDNELESAVISNDGKTSEEFDDSFDSINSDDAQSIEESKDENISKNQNKDQSKAKLSDSSVIIITDASYSKYFDSRTGTIKEGTIKEGETLKIGNVSNKLFIIDRPLTILPVSSEDIMSDCLIRLIEGSSYTTLSNLRIVNKNEKVKSYYLCGIHIYNSYYNTIVNLTINNTQMRCYGILMSNASHNKIINNTIITGQATAIPMTGSSYNLFEGNYLETYNANMLYYSMYGNGDFYPREDLEKCHDNIIANNYFTSRNGTYDSYCYALCLMAEAGGSNTLVANNTFNNTFRPLVISTPDTLVINNTIVNVGGEAGIFVEGANVSLISNNISTVKVEGYQWNKNGDVVAIKTSGFNTKIINNTISTVQTNGIQSNGDNSVIVGNIINTESSSCINLTRSNALVENNTLNGVNSTPIKIYTSKLVENTTIRNNNITSDLSAIVLQGKVNYTLVCDNVIEVVDADNAIVVAKYTNRNPILPEHYAIFNNLINGKIVNLTDISEIKRNDTVNDTNVTDSNVTDINGTNASDINGTGINGTDINNTDINGTEVNGTDIDSNITRLPSVIHIYNSTVIRHDYLEIYLTDENDNPISNATILFYFHDNVYTKTTDSEGKARLQFNAIPDNHTLNISFIGNKDYLPSNITVNVSVIPVTYYVNESNFYDFFDDDGYIKINYNHTNLIFQGDFNDKRIILDTPVNLISDSAVLYDSVIKITSSKVTVDGFKIINRNPGNIEDNHRFTISLDNVRNVTVMNNDIKLNSFDNGYGIYLSESVGNSIFNNTIDLKAKKLTFGIMLYDSRDNSIQNNSIKVNGTDNPHQYESTIQVDTSISIDDYEADGMIIPEVYKTYGIILFYSSNNDIGYNSIKASSGLTKYYTAVKESTNSIVGIDVYYDSNYNSVHHNNVVVSAKDPYLYGLGVLGAETGKRDQFATNNSFTDNIVFVNGTYYAAGIIAGYNSINTTMLRNYIICFSNNVSYGVILEGAERSLIDSNYVISRSRINYVVEGYDSDHNVISNNTLNAYGQYVGDVSLYNSNYNSITKNKLSPIFREGKFKGKGDEFPDGINLVQIFKQLETSDPSLHYTEVEWRILLDTDLTDHNDVIPPHTSEFYYTGGTGNTFTDNEVPPYSGGNGNTNESGSGKTNSNGNGNANNGNSNSNSTAVNDGSGDGSSGSQSKMDGSGENPESDVAEGNTVGTTSSAAVSESARAYNLDVNENAAASRSLSFGGMNIPVLCILFLLIFACASELVKRSKRNIR